MSTKDHESTLAALSFIRERLDNSESKIDRILEKLEAVSVDHARCLTKCDVNSETLKELKTQAEHSKKFRTQARTVIAVFGALWAVMLALLEFWRRK